MIVLHLITSQNGWCMMISLDDDPARTSRFLTIDLALLRFLPVSCLLYTEWLISDFWTADSSMLTSTPTASYSPFPLLYDNDSLMTQDSLYLWSSPLIVFVDSHVYKRPTSRLENSKRVLFCINTSRRRTCLSLILWIPILGEYPTLNP